MKYRKSIIRSFFSLLLSLSLVITYAINPIMAGTQEDSSKENKRLDSSTYKVKLPDGIQTVTESVYNDNKDNVKDKTILIKSLAGENILNSLDFSDNFDDGNNDGWNVIDGVWAVENGQYSVNGGDGTKSVIEGSNYGDFTYEVDISDISATGNAGVLFRASNIVPGNTTINGYYVGIDASRGLISLGKFMNNNYTELASVSSGIVRDTMFHIKIEADGSNIRIYKNSAHVLSAADNAYTSGALGFRTWRTHAHFDNINVNNSIPQNTFAGNDNFDDGNDYGWNIIDGVWSVESGQYSVSGGDGSKSIIDSLNYSNFTCELDLLIQSTTGNAGVLFRASNIMPGNNTTNGYYAGIDAGRGLILLGKFVNNNYVDLASIPSGIVSNTVYHIKIEADGTNIRIYKNSVQVLSVGDTTYSSGAIGVRTWRQHTHFDNISITNSVSQSTFGGSDNFEDGNDYGWNVIDGVWTVESGIYSVGGGAGVKSIIYGSNYSDFTCEVDISDITATGNAGVLFRASNIMPGNTTTNGYYAGIDANRGLILLGKFINNSYVELAAVPSGIARNTMNHIKVETVGANIKIYKNFDQVLNITDTTYTSGAIGFKTWNTHAHFDNIAIENNLPDFIITDITWSPSEVIEGDTLTFNAAVKNQGTLSSPANVIHGVNFCVDGVKVAWNNGYISSIAKDTTVNISVTEGVYGPAWNAIAGNHTVTANVDMSNLILESNEDNNTFSKQITVITKPTVSILTVSDITSNSATIRGSVTSDGYNNVTEKGIVYSTSSNPTIVNTKATAGNGIGEFSASLNGLASHTTYFVRAYAINSAGTVYGNEVSFTTNELVSPDLIITDISWEPTDPVEGDSIAFTATVKNKGTGASPDGVIHGIGFYIDGTEVSWSTLYTSSIAPGDSIQIIASAGDNGSTWTAIPGTHTVSANIDGVYNRITESDENNNWYSESIDIQEVFPDLQVWNISYENDKYCEGQTVNFTATICNMGAKSTPAEGFRIKFQFDDGTEVYNEYTVVLTPPSQPTTAFYKASIPWTAISGSHTVTVTVDDNNTVIESNETNNVQTKTINNIKECTQVELGADTLATIAISGEEDWYRVNVDTTNGYIRVNLELPSKESGVTWLWRYLRDDLHYWNYDLEVYNSTGKLIAISKSEYNMDWIRYKLSATSSGWYYIRIVPKDSNEYSSKEYSLIANIDNTSDIYGSEFDGWDYLGNKANASSDGTVYFKYGVGMNDQWGTSDGTPILYKGLVTDGCFVGGEYISSGIALWNNAGIQGAPAKIFEYNSSSSNIVEARDEADATYFGYCTSEKNPFRILLNKARMSQSALLGSNPLPTNFTIFEVATNIVAHEFGHALGLRDLYISGQYGINNEDKLMYGYTSLDSMNTKVITNGRGILHDKDKLGAKMIRGWTTTTAYMFPNKIENNGSKYVSASYPYVNDEQKYKRSSLIVKGKVKDVIEAYKPDNDFHYTKVTLEVDKYFNKNVGKNGNEIEFLQDGNSQMLIMENELFKKGDECIVFLETSSTGSLILLGGPQGRYDISRINNEIEIENHIDKHIRQELEKKGLKTLKKSKKIDDFAREIELNISKYKDK